MKTNIFSFDPKKDKGTPKEALENFIREKNISLEDISLSLVFGSVSILSESLVKDIYKILGENPLIGCSSGGEIYNTTLEQSLVITMLSELGEVKTYSAICSDGESYKSSVKLGEEAKAFGECSLGLVFGDGMIAESEDVLRGLQKSLGKSTKLFGGFAGDDGKFVETYQIVNGDFFKKSIVLALVKTPLEIGVAWGHGFQPLGLGREVTQIKDGEILSIDNKSTLDFYRDYLDEEQVQQMPLLGHQYPLGVSNKQGKDILIRAIFDANQKSGSCIIRGSKCKIGDKAHVMLGQKKKVIKSAVQAAENAKSQVRSPKVAIIIDCFGRKMIFKKAAEEEIHEIKKVFGNIPLVGLYSYGEISPVSGESEYHNMTANILVLG
ncbi:hypothetical protein HON22_03235 [Candidatus Peregrinibacteria bacterium]|jgi:hypothetical protein|nr:hypothetical protein [Candidatus Peregrinibacteria bacterium]